MLPCRRQHGAMTPLPAESLVAAMARLRSQDARRAHLGQILRIPLSYPPTKLVNDVITDCSRALMMLLVRLL